MIVSNRANTGLIVTGLRRTCYGDLSPLNFKFACNLSVYLKDEVGSNPIGSNDCQIATYNVLNGKGNSTYLF